MAFHGFFNTIKSTSLSECRIKCKRVTRKCGKMCPSPWEKVSRRKTYIYILLALSIVSLLYAYSFPFQFNTNIFVFRNGYFKSVTIPTENTIFSDAISSENKTSLLSNLLRINKTKTVSINSTSSQENIINRTFTSNLKSFFTSNLYVVSSSTTPLIVSSQKYLETSVPQNTVSSKSSIDDKASIAEVTYSSQNSVSEENISPKSDVKKGFLVFSDNCKIPDFDPMHPSILEFVKIHKPLNCTEEEPITRTEGNVLRLDEEAAKRRGFTNYTCCYKYVFRVDNGQSDDHVGFGKCNPFVDNEIITGEFIEVTCTNTSGQVLYHEFHSFIHDKPEVEERCAKEKEPPYSIMIIGIDGVSRLNMHRQMNKTVQYLLNNMDAIEMFGFNKIGDNTFPNLIALLMGYDERELAKVCWDNVHEPIDNCNFIWKRFAQKGYRTLYAEDSPHISSFNYVKKGFYMQPTDYYFRHFILAYENALGWKEKQNCKLCVGSVSETEAILHWNQLFASHFKNRAYFSFSWINSLTHDYLNDGSKGDHMYESFFRTLHESGDLNRTIVILMADHGMRWGSIRKTFIGRLEERLPMLFIMLPPDFKKKYPKETNSLRVNSHRLTTPFDLHATLVNILNLEEEWSFYSPDYISEGLAQNFTNRAHTLFQEVPEHRSCDDAFIEEHWCTCESSLPMDLHNEDVKKVAKFIVRHINSLLKPVSNVCSKLKLLEISDARILLPSSTHTGHTETDRIFTVILQTKPGSAVFEGTVRVSPPSYDCELLGTISRLNLYGNSSACVQDAILKKYCFCS